jgi:hypothetical protein
MLAYIDQPGLLSRTQGRRLSPWLHHRERKQDPVIEDESKMRLQPQQLQLFMFSQNFAAVFTFLNPYILEKLWPINEKAVVVQWSAHPTCILSSYPLYLRSYNSLEGRKDAGSNPAHSALLFVFLATSWSMKYAMFQAF